MIEYKCLLLCLYISAVEVHPLGWSVSVPQFFGYSFFSFLLIIFLLPASNCSSGNIDERKKGAYSLCVYFFFVLQKSTQPELSD